MTTPTDPSAAAGAADATTVPGSTATAGASISAEGAADLLPGDPRLAHRADGVLGQFNRAGVLTAADLHVATRIAELGGEPDDDVRLAIALLVRALRSGSVCLDLSGVAASVVDTGDERHDVSGLAWPEPAEWLARVRSSVLTIDEDTGNSASATDDDRAHPLRVAAGLVYLDRYRRYEVAVARAWGERAALAEPVDEDALTVALGRLFPEPGANPQRLAVAVAVGRLGSVIAGGPGTGKTFTVARLLAALLEQPGPPPRIELAASTGKAAARLREAVIAEADQIRLERGQWPELTARTWHKLHGWRPVRGHYVHGADNPLDADVVVVDEASMISLPQMASLLAAVRPQTRLVLIGDADQLASVDAGAVLGDLVRADGPDEAELSGYLGRVAPSDLTGFGCPVNGVASLTRRYRFDGEIAELADAVMAGDADAVLAVLRAGGDGVEFIETDLAETPVSSPSLAGLVADVTGAGESMVRLAGAGDAEAALSAMLQHRLLCGHRRGPYGVARWSAEVRHRLGVLSDYDNFVGRPVMAVANDYEIGVFNGDSGVVVPGPGNRLDVRFEQVTVPAVRVGALDSVYAMTVHKAQGSQFDRVTLIAPPADSPIATRELLYTAVTRAQTFVRVVGTEDAIRSAVARPVARASGLRVIERPDSPGPAVAGSAAAD